MQTDYARTLLFIHSWTQATQVQAYLHANTVLGCFRTCKRFIAWSWVARSLLADQAEKHLMDPSASWPLSDHSFATMLPVR